MLASILGGVASGVGGLLGANAQAKAAKKATRLQRDMFNKQVDYINPIYQRGQSSNALLDSLYGMGGASPDAFNQAFYNSPFYKVQFEGALPGELDSIMRRNAASGINNGRTMMALSDRARDLVSRNALSPFVSGITGASQQGANAANALAGYAGQFGDNAAQGAYNVGNAQAAGFMGAGNSFTNTLRDIQQQRNFDRVFPGGSTSAFGGF